MTRHTVALCLAAVLAAGAPSVAIADQSNPRHPSAAGRGPRAVDRAVPRGQAGAARHAPGPPPAVGYRGRPAPPAYYGGGRPPAYYGGYGGYGGSRYYGVRPVYYPRPYYAFAPRVSVGLGVWAGFPVAFPAFGVGVGVGVGGPYVGAYAYPGAYAYGYPVYPAYARPYPVPYPVPQPYPVPYPMPQGAPYGAGAYGQYPPQGTVTAQPAPAQTGGLSFEIDPADAVIYVDGAYAGPVASFGPTTQPLSLSPGVHRIEIQAPGHQPLAFDATITAGLVVPYRGTLAPRD
jgi:hypothetical protein